MLKLRDKKSRRAIFLVLLLVFSLSGWFFLFKSQKAEAAVGRLGSVINIQNSADSGSQSVTVPSGSMLAVVAIEGYSSTTTKISGFTSLSLGGLNMTLQRSDLDSTSDGDQSGIFTLVNPTAGSQTLSWNWGGSTAWSDGGQMYVSFYNGVNTSSPVGTKGGQGINGASNVATASSGSLTIATGDAVVAAAYFSDLGTVATMASRSSWNNITAASGPAVFNNSVGSYAETSPAAGTTTVSSSQTNSGNNWTTMSAIVIKAPTNNLSTTRSYVGSFSVPSSTGNFSVSGVGFQPKALLFWGNGETADGSHSSGTQNWTATKLILGMADGTSQAALYDNDDFTSGDPEIDTSHALKLIASNGQSNTVEYQGALSSFDTDGFTVNFSTINGTHGTGDIINFMALGGSDLSNASIKSFTAPTTTGSQSYGGLGFQPDGMVLIGGNNTALSGGLGMASGSSSMGALSSVYNQSTHIGNYQRTDQAYAEVSGTTKRYEAALTSFDVGGFTLNWTTATATNASSMFALCLKGPSFKAGSFAQKTSTGSQSYNGVGFQPSALLTFSNELPASTAIGTSFLGWMVGGADGSNRGVIAATDNARLTDSLTRSKILQTVDDGAGPTVTGAADLTSFDSDGFTLNYAASDGTARQILYFAIGPPAANTAPAAPTLVSPAAGGTNVSALPLLQVRASDANSDYLRYKIQLCQDASCSTVLQTFDQTASQVGWRDQDQQSGTAYTGSSVVSGSTIAGYLAQTALSINTTYYWRAYAIDPGGSDTFSSASAIQSFTTTASSTNVKIQGGSVIRGGTIVQ